MSRTIRMAAEFTIIQFKRKDQAYMECGIGEAIQVLPALSVCTSLLLTGPFQQQQMHILNR